MFLDWLVYNFIACTGTFMKMSSFVIENHREIDNRNVTLYNLDLLRLIYRKFMTYGLFHKPIETCLDIILQ